MGTLKNPEKSEGTQQSDVTHWLRQITEQSASAGNRAEWRREMAGEWSTSSSLYLTSFSQSYLRPRAVEPLIIRDREPAEDGEAA